MEEKIDSLNRYTYSDSSLMPYWLYIKLNMYQDNVEECMKIIEGRRENVF